MNNLLEFKTNTYNIKQYFKVSKYEIIKEYTNISFAVLIELMRRKIPDPKEGFYKVSEFFCNDELMQHVIDNCIDFECVELIYYATSYSSKNIVVQLINKGCNINNLTRAIKNVIKINLHDTTPDLVRYLLMELKDISLCFKFLKTACNRGLLYHYYFTNYPNPECIDHIINILLDHISLQNKDIALTKHCKYKLITSYNRARINKYVNETTIKRIKRLCVNLNVNLSEYNTDKLDKENSYIVKTYGVSACLIQ